MIFNVTYEFRGTVSIPVEAASAEEACEDEDGLIEAQEGAVANLELFGVGAVSAEGDEPPMWSEVESY